MGKVAFLSTFEPMLKSDGTVNAGGKLNFYKVGTSTRKNTYSDVDLTIANANPVILDSAGRAVVFLDGDYKLTYTDSSDVTIYTRQNINPAPNTIAQDVNLIKNGSFEIDDDGDGIPDDWTLVSYTGAANARSTSTVSHGNYSYQFSSTGSGGGYLETTNYMNCSSLEQLGWSFEIKSSIATCLNIAQIRWFDKDEALVSTSEVYTTQTTNPTTFTLYIGNVTAPATATQFKVRIVGVDPSVPLTANVWFDNLRIVPSPVQQQSVTLGIVLAAIGQAPTI